MTNEQQKAKELAKLLTAFADGKQLQRFYKPLNEWGELLNQTLESIIQLFTDGEILRIKPETKRVPLNQQDLIERIKDGKTMWVKHGIACMLILDFNDELVFFSDDEFSYEQLTSLEWIDGTPCYKEVECE